MAAPSLLLDERFATGRKYLKCQTAQAAAGDTSETASLSSLPYLADRFTDAGTRGALLSARVLSLKAMKMGFMDEPFGLREEHI
ncbi:hypothetical protein IFM47457_10869 [Aspergillus lentulus]|nr:hypothetical protein IFM47457_10869 [Aspergillus lentulus]